jgi:hypothetical protein
VQCSSAAERVANSATLLMVMLVSVYMCKLSLTIPQAFCSSSSIIDGSDKEYGMSVTNSSKVAEH